MVRPLVWQEPPPSGRVTTPATAQIYLKTGHSSPAGTVQVTVTYDTPTTAVSRFVGLQHSQTGAVFAVANADGGTVNYGSATPPVGVLTWTPTFTVPAEAPCTLRWWRAGGAAASESAVFGPLMVPGVTPAGVLDWWADMSIANTSVRNVWNRPNDPWVSNEAAETVLAVRKSWSGVSTITVPLTSPFTGSTATVTAAPGSGGPAPTLVSADGATVGPGNVLTLAKDVSYRTVWQASGGAVLQVTRGTGGAQPPLYYAPIYLDFPPVPPTPPTITKLIPTSGPDTGGTLVDIVGTDLTGATAVDFGGAPGTGLTVDPSGNLATVTTPAHTAGPAPVTITTPAGTSAAETFLFEAPPVVTVPVIYEAYPLRLCADALDSGQVLIPIIYPITDVVSAEVGGVPAGISASLDGDEVGFVLIIPPSLSPGTYDLILTNSAGSSDPWPIEYIDCEGCPPDPTVVAVFPGAALPGATIQIVGTNLTGATVTMCGDPVSILSNDGTIITVVVPPGCPDGPATITVTTPDGETTVEFTVLPPEPVPPADVSPRSWQIAQALLDAAFLCGAECARAFVTTDATPEGPPPGGCPCQLTATIVKDGYKTADGRRLVRSATIKLSLHQCTPIPQADEIPDPDTESDYALRQAETRDQMLRGLATARRQPSSVLGRCQTKQASEGWVHVSTTGGMSLYTMEVTVD